MMVLASIVAILGIALLAGGLMQRNTEVARLKIENQMLEERLLKARVALDKAEKVVAAELARREQTWEPYEPGINMETIEVQNMMGQVTRFHVRSSDR